MKPILERKADVVVGDRQMKKNPGYSWIKRKSQQWGSSWISRLANIDIKDAVSGFRSYSREAALRINILTTFSYTIENLIQLKNQKFKIISVPVKTNKKLRESRLFKSVPGFLSSQLSTLLKAYLTYRPLKIFTILGFLIMLPGIFGFLRYLYYIIISGSGKGHIQSLVFSVVFLNVGFVVFMFGIIAELVNSNRKLIEKILFKLKQRKN